MTTACGSRGELWGSGPGPLDGSAADEERRCPRTRPRLNSDCAIGEPPYACEYQDERCDDGSRATRVYSCYAGREESFWFYGDARACACPAELPVEGTSCTAPSPQQGDCKYYVGGCGTSCTCSGMKWSCQSACAGASGCPAVRPARFMPCAPTGLSCTYPQPNCTTTSACVAREGAPAGAEGVWVTIASPDPCNGI